jgi:hypothetical protein
VPAPFERNFVNVLIRIGEDVFGLTASNARLNSLHLKSTPQILPQKIFYLPKENIENKSLVLYSKI